jgi:arabinan endo-1,5-alpha-L-arabinosidase
MTSGTYTFCNPVLDHEFPDPHVLSTPCGFYAYATQNDELTSGRNIQVAHSNDMVNWQLHEHGAFVEHPSWSTHKDYWAPHVELVDGIYRMYCSVDSIQGGKQICFAKSALPTGFTDTGSPLTQGGDFRNIDPCFFDNPITRNHHLLWGSEFGPIISTTLLNDGHMCRSYSIQPVLFPQPDQPYENLIEGLSLLVVHHEQRQRLYAFVSGDDAQIHYAIIGYELDFGLQVIRKLGVVFRGNKYFANPGQNSFVKDREGTIFMYYHAVDMRRPLLPNRRYRRVMCMERVDITKDGNLIIGNGSPSFTPQLAPII